MTATAWPCDHTPASYLSTQRGFGTPKGAQSSRVSDCILSCVVILGVLGHERQEINQSQEDGLIRGFWGLRTTLDYNLLSCHSCSANFHFSLK